MKILRFSLTVLLLFACALGAYAISDTLSVDTSFITAPEINSWTDLIGSVREVLGGDTPMTFEMFYVYVVAASTFILGFLRNLLPKWEWIQKIGLGAIPREVTVAIAGLSVALFILYSGVDNVNWMLLVGAVFGTQGVYATVKSLVEKIPNEAVQGVLLFMLGKFTKGRDLMTSKTA